MLRTLLYLSVGIWIGYRFLHPYLTDEEGQPPAADNRPSPPPPAAKNGPAQAQTVEKATANLDQMASDAVADEGTAQESGQDAAVVEEAHSADTAPDEQEIDLNAVSPANLQRIKGIGPTYAKRLVAAGIGSIAQLAHSDPARVAEITKVKAWQRPGPAEWIAEAQIRAKK